MCVHTCVVMTTKVKMYMEEVNVYMHVYNQMYVVLNLDGFL